MSAIDATKTNPKYFYSFLKTDIMVLTDADNNLESDPSKLSELFSQQFVMIYSAPNETKIILDPETFFHVWWNRRRNPCEVQFMEANILKAVQTIRPTAASGPDEFPGILLKNCDRELVKLL